MKLKLSLFSNLTSKNCDNIENLIIKELKHEVLKESNPNTQKTLFVPNFFRDSTLRILC